MARMETHNWDNLCLQMLHGKSMAGFAVLNNIAYDVMANEELMVLITKAHSQYYMTIRMGQCMYATIAKYNTPWFMIHPEFTA
jgi:hypothetical protein